MAGAYHDPSDDINRIRILLTDQYKLPQNGQVLPIIKELVQNADDAEASSLHIGWCKGFAKSSHPLLQRKAMFVVNNGKFKRDDTRGIRKIGADYKASDKYSIGKFGLGLKSVFHLCEAFFHLASEGECAESMSGYEFKRNDIFNLWSGIDKNRHTWDNFSIESQDIIQKYLKSILDEMLNDWFCLWLPLRIKEDTPRFTSYQPSPEQIFSPNIEHELAKLLPFLKKLTNIVIWQPEGDTLKDVVEISLDKKSKRQFNFDDMVGHQELIGKIDITTTKPSYLFRGIHGFCQHHELDRLLQDKSHWPTSSGYDIETGKNELSLQDKAKPHVGVCFIKGDSQEQGTLTISWAVFLPLSDSKMSEQLTLTTKECYHLTLHGYFFVDAGRAAFDLESDDNTTTHHDIRPKWNTILAQKGTAPLLLPALEQFVQHAKLSREAIESLTKGLSQSKLFKNYRTYICYKSKWVCCVSDEGLSWKLLDKNIPVYPLHPPIESDPERPYKVFPALKNIQYLTYPDKPFLADCTFSTWSVKLLLELLQSIDVTNIFTQETHLKYFVDFFEKCEGQAKNDSAVETRLNELLTEAFLTIEFDKLRSHKALIQRFVALISSSQRFTLDLGKSPEGENLAKSVIKLPLDTLIIPKEFAPDNEPTSSPINSDVAEKILRHVIAFKPQEENSPDLEKIQSSIISQIIKIIVPDQKADLLRNCADLALIKCFDLQVGQNVLLTIGALNQFVEQRTVFEYQTLDRAMPIFEPLANHLQQALPQEQVILITKEFTSFTTQTIEKCTIQGCIEVLQKRPTLAEPDKRIDLLRDLLNQDILDKPTLRYLLHGQKKETTFDTLYLPSSDNNATVWNKLAQYALTYQNQAWCFINVVLPWDTPREHIDVLNLKIVKRTIVEEMLTKLRLPAKINVSFSPEESEILWRELKTDDLLRRLPIYQTTTGELVFFDYNTFLKTNFEISSGLQNTITLLPPHTDGYIANRQKEVKVPELTPLETLRLIFLRSRLPQDYIEDILNALALVSIQDETLLLKMQKLAWLPKKEIGHYLSPEDIIYIPDMEEEITNLITKFEEIFFDVQILADFIYNKRNLLKDRNILLSDEDALAMLSDVVVTDESQRIGEICKVDKKIIWQQADLEAFLEVFKSSPELMPACSIIETIYQKTSAKSCIEWFLPGLAQPISTERTIKILNHLAEQHAKSATKKKAILLKVHGWYLDSACKIPSFEEDILPKLNLRNKLGEWKAAYQLGYELDGISDKDLVDVEQGKKINSNKSEKGIELDNTPDEGGFKGDNAEKLKDYFKDWAGVVDDEVIGGFLALLGDELGIRKLAEQYLKRWDIETVRQMFEWQEIKQTGWEGNFSSVLAKMKYRIKVNEVTTKTSLVQSICGTWFEARHAESSELKNIFVGKQFKPDLKMNDGVQVNEIALQKVSISMGLDEPARLTKLIRESARKIIETIYWQKIPNFERVWKEKLEQSAILDIYLVQTLLLDSAFFYLRQLGIHTQTPPLLKIMDIWEDFRRQEANEEQLKEMGQPGNKDLSKLKRKIRTNLSELIENDELVQASILEAIRQKMSENQYSYTSVPFELFQNADDALVELQELKSEVINPTCIITWDKDKLSFSHWGRPINEYGEGENSSYSRDLEKMLILSYSDKSMEQDKVTGRFGLGFKSVFLITNCPRIASGRRLGFEVIGGIYPRRLVGENLTTLQDKVRPEGTIFELPFYNPDIADEVVESLKQVAHILPVFLRKIKEIELNTDKVMWHKQALLNSPHISTGQLHPLTTKSKQQALLFEMPDGSLLFRLTPNKFNSFDKEIATLWVTVPTSHELDLGFLINSQFDLDVGRNQLASKSTKNDILFSKMGQQFGDLLCQIYDLAHNNWTEFVKALHLDPEITRYEFWKSLWELLGVDFVDKAGKENYKLIKSLIWSHGKGMNLLITTWATIPTNLWDDYKQLTYLNQIKYVTTGKLDTEDIFKKVSSWPSFRQNVQVGEIIRKEIKDNLDKLLPNPLQCKDFRLHRAIDEAVPDENVSPKLAEQFGNLPDSAIQLEYEEIKHHFSKFYFLAQDGTYQLAAKLLHCFDDETYMSQFAPPNRILNDAYQDKAFSFFKTCRSGRSVSNNELVTWAINATNETAQIAVLRHVLSHKDFATALRNEVWFPYSWLVSLEQLLEYFTEPESNELMRLLHPTIIEDLHLQGEIKIKRQQQDLDNKRIGANVEQIIQKLLRNAGLKVSKAHVGYDMDVWMEDGWDGGPLKIESYSESYLVEVKFTRTTQAHLSKSQGEKARQETNKYIVLVVKGNSSLREKLNQDISDWEIRKELLDEVSQNSYIIESIYKKMGNPPPNKDEIEAELTGYWVKKLLWQDCPNIMEWVNTFPKQ